MSYKGVVIDAGHGGNDSGAIGNSIVEKDLNLKISKYIHSRLDELGVKNVLDRTSDISLSPSERVKLIKSYYGTSKEVLLISNHINAGGGEGSEIIYALRDSDKFSKIIADNLTDINRYVRKYYQKRSSSDTSKDYYFILRDTANMEAVIVEYGFLDNSNDASLLKNNWEKYAEAVVKSICEYIGVNYVSSLSLDYYIVKKGDSLWSISKANNLSVDKLKDINNLNSNLLYIGQKLLLKDNKQYVVKKGDTLWNIAKKYNTTVDKLMEKNKLTSSSLKVGQILNI